MPSDKVERRHENRKREVVDTAVEMIVADGALDKVSLGRVASKLDLTPPALYRYFDSVDELMASVYVEFSRRVASEFMNVFERAERFADGRDVAAKERSLFRLLAVVPAVAYVAKHHPALTQVIHQVNFGGLSFRHEGTDLSDVDPTDVAPVKAGAALFEMAQADCAISRDGKPSDRFIVYWASIQSLTALAGSHRWARGTTPCRSLAMVAARTLLVGWGAHGDALDGASEHAKAWATTLD